MWKKGNCGRRNPKVGKYSILPTKNLIHPLPRGHSPPPALHHNNDEIMRLSITTKCCKRVSARRSKTKERTKSSGECPSSLIQCKPKTIWATIFASSLRQRYLTTRCLDCGLHVRDMVGVLELEVGLVQDRRCRCRRLARTATTRTDKLWRGINCGARDLCQCLFRSI